MPDTVIWFDFGGVLSPSPAELFAAYERKTGIPPRQLAAALREVSRAWGEDALAALELGHVTEAEWGREIGQVLAAAGVDRSRARLENFGAQWFEGIHGNAAMLGAARRLRRDGHRTGVLSNNVREWEPYWRPIIAPAGGFDLIIDSSRVGVRKPDPRIYRLAETAAGSGAASVLIDDVAENVEAALAAGWQAIHFQASGQALRDLGALLGGPPPGGAGPACRDQG